MAVPTALFQVFKVVASVMIPLASFLTGLRAVEVDPFWLVKRPSLLLRSLLATLVIVPIGTIAFLQAIAPPPLVEAGLIVSVLAIGIGPPAVFKHTRATEDVAYEVELNIILMTLAIVFIPLAVGLTGAYFGLELRLEGWRVAEVVLTRAVVPLLMGVAVARFVPSLGRSVARVAAPMVEITLLGVVALALLATWRGLVALGLRGWIVAAAVAAGALAVGHLSGGPDRANRAVLARFSAIRFPGLALLIASVVPSGKQLVPVVLAYVISSVVLATIYEVAGARRRRRRTLAPAPA